MGILKDAGMPLIPAEFIYRDLLGCRRFKKTDGRRSNWTDMKEEDAMRTSLLDAVRPHSSGFRKANLSYPVGAPTREHDVLSLGQAGRALTRYDYVNKYAECALRPTAKQRNVSPHVLCQSSQGVSNKCATRAQGLESSRRAVALAAALMAQLELHCRPATACPYGHQCAGGGPGPSVAIGKAASFSALRETHFTRTMKAHILDTLEISLTQALPGALRRGNLILDVGAGGGEISGYLAQKYGVHVKAYDVKPAKDNHWANKDKLGFPVEVFDGHALPLEANQSRDIVLFNAVLHHAARHAPLLIREAARISRTAIVLIEDVNVEEELNPAKKSIRSRNKGHDKRGRFRTQREWISLLEEHTGFVVTSIRTVCPRDLSNFTEYYQQHRIAGDKHVLDLSGPTYQRLFVAQRCVPCVMR